MTDSDRMAELASGARTAAPEVPQTEEQERISLLLIESGEHWFGIAADSVREVVMRERLSRLPAVPSHILGMALISGRLVPVVSVDRLAGGNGADVAAGRLVVVHDGARELALAASRTQGLLELSRASGQSQASERVDWVTDQVRWDDALVGMLDVAGLIDAATVNRAGDL